MSASTFTKANPNRNFLAGFHCPGCGSFGPFEIEESTLTIWFDDDFGYEENLGWTADSYCRCRACWKDGRVRDFWDGTEGGA